MILGRRDPLGLLKRLRGWLWPRTGWRRAGHYLVTRVKRTPGTPRGIAAGVATGVAVSLTPFVGLYVLTLAIVSPILASRTRTLYRIIPARLLAGA